jgi:putative GTP pyrophosphokinase
MTDAPEALAQNDLRQLRDEFTRFMLSYKFGIDEVLTKINILREEFNHGQEYNPIEHVNSRLKSPESILEKATRKNVPLSVEEIRANILDIAGVRITCSFLSDTYRIRDMLTRQGDLTVLVEHDYVASPKPNGYKSLHLIVEVPVFMSDRVQPVSVEIQIRTIAMDFWASLEHKIYYKYEGDVPLALVAELTEAADAANRLDVKMERLHDEVVRLGEAAGATAGIDDEQFGSRIVVPDEVLAAMALHRAAGAGASAQA